MRFERSRASNSVAGRRGAERGHQGAGGHGRRPGRGKRLRGGSRGGCGGDPNIALRETEVRAEGLKLFRFRVGRLAGQLGGRSVGRSADRSKSTASRPTEGLSSVYALHKPACVKFRRRPARSRAGTPRSWRSRTAARPLQAVARRRLLRLRRRASPRPAHMLLLFHVYVLPNMSVHRS